MEGVEPTPPPPCFLIAAWNLGLEEPVFRAELRVLQIFLVRPGLFYLLTWARVGPWQFTGITTADARRETYRQS